MALTDWLTRNILHVNYDNGKSSRMRPLYGNSDKGIKGIVGTSADQQKAQGYIDYQNKILRSLRENPSTPYQEETTYAPTGGGGYAYDPNTDPNAVQQGRNTLRDKIASLNNLYSSIYGDLQNMTNAKRGELEKNYGEQYKAADQGYQTGLGQIQNVMSSRGITDSSYNAEAQGTAKDAYTRDITNLDQAKQADLAKIAEFYNSAYGGLQGGQQQLAAINPDQYGAVSDINSAVGQIDQQAQSLGTQRANLMTNSQLAQQLQGIAPAKSMTSDELTKQLQTLVTSSAPRFAKEQIAQGLIKRAQLEDPNAQAFWSDYFQKLLAGSPAGA